jgi:hypothetical protein
MILKPTTIYVDLDGNVLEQSRKSIYRYSDINEIRLVTPLAVQGGMRINFLLSNGVTIEQKVMTALTEKETVNGEQWNVWSYRPTNVITATLTALSVVTLQLSFTQITVVSGKQFGNTFGTVTLSVNPTIQGPEPTLEDATALNQLDADISTLTTALGNKVDEDLTVYSTLSIIDEDESFVYVYYNGGSYKIALAQWISLVNEQFDTFSQRLTTLEGLIDQDVSIGANPHFNTATANQFILRGPEGQTSAIDYDDALAVNATAGHIADTTIHFTADSVTKTDVGLGNVDNTADLDKPISTATQSALDNKQDTLVSSTNIKTINSTTILGTGDFALIPASEKGANNGVATLDAGGKVPAGQLPSFVDDLEEYANLAAFPVTGDSDKIYVALDTNKVYRWSGSVYVEIAANEVNSVNSKTGVVTLVAGDIGVTTTGYNGFLETTDDTVQKVADKVAVLDSTKVNTVTTSFNKLLATADNTVQKALDTLDDHTHTEADITDLDKYTQTEVDALLADKANVADLSSTIILYPTTAASDISGYSRLVDSIGDADYDTPAVNVPTGAVSGQNVLIASLAADAGLFIGNPGVINISVVGKIRKTAGGANQGGEFYYEVYLRNAGGTETLLSTSDTTRTVTAATYQEFFASALLNNGQFTATDRLVYKFYGNNVGGGSPEFDFEFGGDAPVRALLPLPVNVTLQADKVFYDNTGQNLVATNVQDAINEIDDLVEEGLTQVVVVKYTITAADDTAGGFTYTRNDVTGITGTFDTGKFVFALPSGIEYVTGGNRLAVKIDGSDGALKRLFYGADDELTEPSATTFAIDFALVNNDVLYAKLYQSLATVSIDIADGAVTEGKIANGAVTTNKLANNAVDLTKVQQIATLTVLGNDTGGTANVKALTAAETKTLLALNNVDNTTDLNKPISSNTQTALDAKVAGPASAVANQVATFDGTTGKIIKDSGFTIATSVPAGAVFTDTGEDNIIEEVQAEGVALAITSKAVNVTRASLGLDTINGLDDVDVTGVADGQALVYDDATGKWIPGEGGGGASVTISTTAPTEAEIGDLWYDSTSGALFIYYNDGDSTQWVEVTYEQDYAEVGFFNTTIAAADTWTDQTGFFTLQKTVSGITATDKPVVDLDLSAATVAEVADIQAAWATIYRVVTGTDTVTFYALEDPTFPEDTDISIKVVK